MAAQFVVSMITPLALDCRIARCVAFLRGNQVRNVQHMSRRTRVRIHLKILYSNFLFIHHEADVGI